MLLVKSIETIGCFVPRLILSYSPLKNSSPIASLSFNEISFVVIVLDNVWSLLSTNAKMPSGERSECLNNK